MLKALFSLFKPIQKSPQQDSSCINLAVFAPMTQKTMLFFIEKVSCYLGEICEKIVKVEYFTDIKNKAAMNKVAEHIRQQKNSLIFSAEALPAEHVTTLQETYNIHVPAVMLLHEGMAPSTPPPHTNILIYPSHALALTNLFNIYGTPLKQVIIVGRSSALYSTPMLQKLAAALKAQKTTIIYLEVDKEAGDLPRFMATHAPHSQLMYISPDAYAIGSQAELIPLAEKYGCRSLSSMDDALSLGANAAAGINLDDMARDTAKSLCHAFCQKAGPPIRKLHAPLTIKLSRTKKRPALKKIELFVSQLAEDDVLVL